MRAFLVLLAALFAIGPATAAPPRDWTRTVTQTPGGSFVLGNPQAPRLVEYVSYTCPHCAHFVAEASETLRSDYVKRGVISIEIRNALRDPYDLTTAILARCGGRTRFFADHEALFANQTAWFEKVKAYDANRGEQAKDMATELAAIADGTGLSDFMAKRGLTPAQQRVCLNDKRTPALLEAMAKDAWEVRKIGGTPSFTFKGVAVEGANDWTRLRPALPALPK